MSDFFKLANMRESCRNFLDKKVEKDKLIKCIETARIAPSACNSQPWSFIVVNSREKSALVAECLQDRGMNGYLSNCPSFIVVCEEETTLMTKHSGAVKEQKYAQMDIGNCTAHICYSALEQGLSTCIIGWINEEKLVENLHIPQGKKVRLVVAVGYSEIKEPRKKIRKNIDDILVYIE